MAVETHTEEPVRDAFRAAFESAVKEHTPNTETDATETETETEEETPETEGKVEPVKVGEAKPEPEVKTETGLLSDDEFKALQTQHADDPVALRKSLEGAFTKKTQALAAERSSLASERTTYERVKDYVPLIDAYEHDPEATLRELAKMNGLEIAPKGSATERPAVAEATAMVDDVLAKFKTNLGPELDYLADSLAPAIQEMVEALTAKSVAPIREQTAGLLNRVASEQTDAIFADFGKDHPDWKEHEDAMLALAQKVQPNGMTEVEYLDHLYNAVTSKARIDKLTSDREADIEREADGRFKKRLAKIKQSGDEAERPMTSASDAEVTKRPPGPVDFHQAFADAKRGVRYSDD